MLVTKILILKLLYIFVGLLTNGVDDVSAQTSCVISPDLDMLTIRDPLGRNIEIHCQCMDDNGIITGTRWFLPNMSIVSTDNLSRPYSTGNAPSRLIIASPFTSADMGAYTCSSDDIFPTIPPGDSITLNTAVDPDGNVNCSIVSTNLPTVTAAGGVIANGTQNVILYCICMRVDSIVIVGQTSWFFNGARITLTQDDGSGNPYSRNNVPSTLTIPSFGTPHDGNYSCGHRLSFDDVATLGDTITLTLPVPIPMINVTVPNSQIVGQSLKLQCKVTTVRDITSRVDIVWRSGGTVLQRIDNVSSTMMSNLLVYTNSYTISQLNTTDNGRVIQCEVVINSSPLVTANNNITLNVTVASCVISPNFTSLTIRNDLGRDVELHCQCINDNGIITGTRWFLPNMSIVSTDSSNRPYSTGTAPSRLIFTSPFTNSDTGTYACSPDNTFPTVPPGDSITLNTEMSAQTSCVISPDFNMLTIRDPLRRDIELHCQCMDDNGIITGTRWFLPNMTTIVPTDSSSRPYSTGFAPSRLIFTSPFNGSDTGIYTCSPDSTFPTMPPGDSITLNTAADPEGGVNCSIVSTNLPTVTAAGGVIANGTQNVILYCVCMRVNSIVTVGQTFWFFNGTQITLTEDDGSGNPYSRDNVPSTLTIPSFVAPHNGTYSCAHNTMSRNLGDSITLNLSVPQRSCSISTNLPTVTAPRGVIANGTQNVILYCICMEDNVTVGPSIWFFNGSRITLTQDNQSAGPFSRDTVPSSLVIPSFITGNDGTYRCESEGNFMSSPDSTITLALPGPSFNVTISPSGTIQGAMLNSPQFINCTASTVSGVESSSVMISWIGPVGSIANDSRVTISPTISSGNTYSSSLRFTYLIEGDSGTYTCNVMILGASVTESVVLPSLVVPRPNVSVTALNDTQTVGQSLTLQCEVTAVRGITSGVDIVWSSGDVERQRMNNVPSTMMSSSLVYTNSYTISQLNTTDEGRVIQCEVVINANPEIRANDNYTLDVNVPTPMLTISPSDPIQGAMVGSPQVINCTVSTVSGVELSSVTISWMGPGGAITTTNGRVSIGSVIDNGNNMFTRSLEFTYLMEGDEGNYTCDVTILNAGGSQSVELQSLTVPTPTVSVTAPTQTVGQPLTLQCEVTTVRGITSRVDIVWSSGGTELQRIDDVSSTMMSNSLVYTNSYTISQLSTTDDGRVIQCEGVINVNPKIVANDTIKLDVIVPTPNVAITAPNNNQTVGQSLTLQCEVTAVRGITSIVDIVWSSGDMELQRMNNVSSTMMSNSLVYTNSYTISQLSTTDDGRVIQCEVVINANPEIRANDNYTLDVNVPTPMLTISPSGPIQGAMVGSPQVINCTVSTVSGVEFSSVTISWMGPGRETILNNSRMNINPTTSSGNTYSSSLQFTYLMEGDEGNYTCNVMILETNAENSTEIENLFIPLPTVNVTSPDDQIVGQSLTLQCEVTTVRGITSRVDIVWSDDSRGLNVTNDTTSVELEDSLLYTNAYTISSLTTDDENRTYQCEVMINSIVTVNNNSSITLDVTVPQATINIMQSREGSVSGLNHTLTCTVIVVSGVAESLVMVNWDREDSVSSLSFDNMTTDDGLQLTRTIEFLPLLEDDGIEHTCSVSVDGFDEANSSDNVTIMVNAPNLTVAVFPPEISGTDIAINLTCIAAVEEDVMLDQYVIYWIFNDAPINQSDTRINITTEESSMQSTLFIRSNETIPTDSGVYTCKVNLTINGTDIFTAFDFSRVRITAISPPLVPIVTSVITASYSANISWIVRSIVNDTETYTVLYGTDMTSLSNSKVIMGSTDLSAINEMFTVNIRRLMPFTKYYFMISANNSVNTTNTAVMNFTTNETAPGIAPQNFMNISVTATSITFQWDSLTARQANGMVRSFTINCTFVSSSVTIINGTSTTGTVGDLDPFTKYSCNIFASTVLPGPTSDPINVTTAQAAPNPPVINETVNINTSTVRVTWIRPTMPNGIITTYTITYNNSTSVSVPYNGTNTQSYDITGLSPYQLITVTITATNGGGTSDPSNETSGRSSEATPGIVVVLDTDRNMIMWSPPLQPNGIITGYQVVYSIYQNDSDRNSDTLSNNTTSYIIEGLNAGVPYEVVVVAFTSAGRGEENDPKVFFSEELPPSKTPENVTSERFNSTSVRISWKPLTLFEAQGFPEYTVTITEMMDTNARRKRQIVSVTTNESFAIFTGLDENTAYTAMVGVRTGVRTGNPSTIMFTDPVTVSPAPTPEDDSGSSVGAIIGGIIGGIFAIVVLIVIIIIIYFVYTSRRQSKDSNKSSPVATKGSFNRGSFSRGSFSKRNESPLMENQDFLGNDHTTFEMNTITDKNNNVKPAISSKPILLKDFAAHVAEMHKNTDHGFEVEYGSIGSDPIRPAELAKSSENTPKNRYANIFGYDDSCVKLQGDGDNESGYINASYIDGHAQPNAYIATQGPMPGTIGDFWQMIWDQKVQTIVMLTKLMEGNKPKCEQYWPTKTGESTNPKPSLLVTFVQAQTFADYEIRVLQVKSTSDPNEIPLEITHFFFTSWPDHGVPRYTTALISFIKRVRQSHSKSSNSPMIVHCSAGVGRTGTFIALDIMLERMPQTHDVNVYECVLNMRKRRTFMVQTKAQYIFIHDALDELITCGETAFNVQSLRVKVSRMSKAIPGTNRTGFLEQFELLQKVSRAVTSDECSDALAEYNKEKNFSVKAIPFNATRVHLSPSKVPGSDYINASFIDGYKIRNAYIATQCPLKSTVDSFWRMLCEFKCGVVVTLCSPQHDSEDFLQYWPEEETYYGNIKVTLTSSSNSNGFDVYKFAVSIQEQASHQVTMLHYTDWPADGVAKDAKALLSLIKEILEIQRTTKNKAVTVMCSDGCARTGTFITISNTLDRIKVEGTLDIFQAVKSSRIRRPGLVANVKQYKFCHEVVAEFLDDFDQYSNFK